MIWNEWYRDQDLQPEPAISFADGAGSTTSTTLQNVAWEKDYFTSARPWEQKGPAVSIPLGTTASIVKDGILTLDNNGSGPDYNFGFSNSAGWVQGAGGSTATQTAAMTYKSGLEADLTGASAITVTLLREALALQRYEEARARYGSKYTEYLRRK